MRGRGDYLPEERHRCWGCGTHFAEDELFEVGDGNWYCGYCILDEVKDIEIYGDDYGLPNIPESKRDFIISLWENDIDIMWQVHRARRCIECKQFFYDPDPEQKFCMKHRTINEVMAAIHQVTRLFRPVEITESGGQ